MPWDSHKGKIMNSDTGLGLDRLSRMSAAVVQRFHNGYEAFVIISGRGCFESMAFVTATGCQLDGTCIRSTTVEQLSRDVAAIAAMIYH